MADLTYRGQEVLDAQDIAWSRDQFWALSTMLWTVDAGQVREHWVVEHSPTLLQVTVRIIGATIAGTPTSLLYVRLPFGKTASHGSDIAGRGLNAGGVTTIAAFIDAGDSKISIALPNLGNWTAGLMNAAFQLTVRTVAQR